LKPYALAILHVIVARESILARRAISRSDIHKSCGRVSPHILDQITFLACISYAAPRSPPPRADARSHLDDRVALFAADGKIVDRAVCCTFWRVGEQKPKASIGSVHTVLSHKGWEMAYDCRKPIGPRQWTKHGQTTDTKPPLYRQNPNC
jgi:hypothetical protein